MAKKNWKLFKYRIENIQLNTYLSVEIQNSFTGILNFFEKLRMYLFKLTLC